MNSVASWEVPYNFSNCSSVTLKALKVKSNETNSQLVLGCFRASYCHIFVRPLVVDPSRPFVFHMDAAQLFPASNPLFEHPEPKGFTHKPGH